MSAWNIKIYCEMFCCEHLVIPLPGIFKSDLQFTFRHTKRVMHLICLFKHHFLGAICGSVKFYIRDIEIKVNICEFTF